MPNSLFLENKAVMLNMTVKLSIVVVLKSPSMTILT